MYLLFQTTRVVHAINDLPTAPICPHRHGEFPSIVQVMSPGTHLLPVGTPNYALEETMSITDARVLVTGLL